jgi:hypothetical protein
MSFSRGEVVLLPIPFTNLTSRKMQPAVVIAHYSRFFAVSNGMGLRESSARSAMFIDDEPRNASQAPSGAAWR